MDLREEVAEDTEKDGDAGKDENNADQVCVDEADAAESVEWRR
jgi:hypothetical protein